jgi:ATP-dependent helicase/nuclease subunit B
MIRSFGLPSPERRLGLSAHDFAQAFSAPSVWITRARTIDGVPTIASRWLIRIEILLRAAAVDQALRSGAQWFAWQALLDQPTRDERRRALPPRPCPPVMARPRRLSVTRIETWMRDPYAIYAEFILGLRALDPIDAEPGAADFGNFVHQALEAFAQRLCRQTGEDPLPLLLECGREAIAPFSHRSGISALWWPRFKRIAVWLTRAENFRDGGVTSSFSEVKGTLLINAPAGFFELTATADRIDQWRDGSLTIIDYKTGALPRLQDVSQGFSPQLPLEAAIASFAGFPDVQPGNPAAIEYWKLDGRRQGGERRSVDPDGTSVAAMAQHALGGLVRLIVEFDRPETAYESCPRQSVSPRYNHYAHLAREKEWAVQAPLED